MADWEAGVIIRGTIAQLTCTSQSSGIIDVLEAALYREASRRVDRGTKGDTLSR